MEYFKRIVYTAHTCIHTDNRNVTFLRETDETRAGRWRLILNEYDYCIKAISGDENSIADELSRNEALTMIKNGEAKDKIQKEIEKMLKTFQVEDDEIQKYQLKKYKENIFIDDQKRIFISAKYSHVF